MNGGDSARPLAISVCTVIAMTREKLSIYHRLAFWVMAVSASCMSWMVSWMADATRR